MTKVDDGWVPLSDPSPSHRFGTAVVVVLPALLLGFGAFQLGPAIGDWLDWPGSLRLALGVLFALAPLLLSAWVWTVLNPVAFVDFQSDQIRLRGRTLAIHTIDLARRIETGAAGLGQADRDDLTLGIRFGSSDGPQVSIVLHQREVGTIAPIYRERIVEVIRRSSISYPTSIYDPTGRFARHNFPEHLDKDGALNLVLSLGQGPTAPSDT